MWYRPLSGARRLRRAVSLVSLLFFGLSGCVVRAPSIESGTRLTVFGHADEPGQPPGVTSNETSAEQLQIAREQGMALGAALRHTLSQVPGAEAAAGEYLVGYVLSAPTGYYEMDGGTLAWNEPTGTAHLAVVVRDGYDGRIVPEARVRVRAMDRGGAEVLTEDLPFGWHPVLNRYADNVTLPPGTYTLRVEVEPPRIRRHDPINGDRYHEPTAAVFEGVVVPERLPAEAVGVEALRWGRMQGDALERSLRAMLNGTAVDGAQTSIDSVRLAYAVEFAESYWVFRDDDLVFDFRAEATSAKNAHVEVATRDALTGRFLPGLTVTTTFLQGEEPVEEVQPGLMWHPWLYHYGENVRVPGTDAYRLRVQVAPPAYRRWTRLGDFFTAPLDFTFDDVNVRTGQK